MQCSAQHEPVRHHIISTDGAARHAGCSGPTRPCVTARRRRQGSVGQVRECTGPAMPQHTYTQRAHNTHSPARLPVPVGRHPGLCHLVIAPSAHHTTPHHTTPHHTTTQRNATQPNTTQHNTTQHNTTQHNTTQHNTTQHNTTQHNTTQHNTTPWESGLAREKDRVGWSEVGWGSTGHRMLVRIRMSGAQGTGRDPSPIPYAQPVACAPVRSGRNTAIRDIREYRRPQPQVRCCQSPTFCTTGL